MRASIGTLAWLSVSFALIAMRAQGTQPPGEDVRPNDYAYGSEIQIGSVAALYVTSLTEDQYRHTTHADLADICVINGRNEVVPFALRRPQVAQSAAAFDPLPLFPLRRSDASSSEALVLKLRAAGTSLDVEQPAAASAAGIAAYLLDASGTGAPLNALRLAWPVDATDFSARVLIESSDDLTRWQPVTRGVPVVNLHFSGQEFVRAQISLPVKKYSFLRLSWMDTPPLTTLTSVSGQRLSGGVEPQRRSISAAGTAQTKSGEFEFDLGAHLPLDRLNLALPEPNTIVNVRFFAQDEVTKIWQPIAGGRLYRLKTVGAEDLINAPLIIPVTSARHWKVRIDSTGGGLGSGVPTMDAGWLPDELLFVARGGEPFHLLYGNSVATAKGSSYSALLDAIKSEPQSATLSAPIAFGGDSRLAPVRPATDWKRWLLWAVLIVAVVTLGAMALRLSRSMR